MKHFYISVAVFLTIIGGSFLSCIYTNRHIKNMCSYIEEYTEKQYFDEDSVSDIAKIKEDFYKNKNMLQLFINKEHIHNVEINILLMENCIKNNDADACREKSIEAISTLRQIQSYSVAID